MEGDRLSCLEVLNDILEPETGIPITKLGLIRIDEVNNDKIVITYLPPSPYTHPLLVILVGVNIVQKMLGKCHNFSVRVENHYLSEEINKRLEGLIRNE